MSNYVLILTIFTLKMRIRNLQCLSAPRPKKFNIVRKVNGHTKRREYSVLDQKYPPWANLAQKIKIPSLGIQFGIQTNSNIKNSIVMLTFFVFHQKNPF